MTKIDNDLIYLRSENARISLKELSRILLKTPQRLKYSISVLEKEGILRDPYCIFDYSYFGLILFRVYFKGAYISEKDKEHIIAELNKNPYVVSIYELTGEFDLTVEFACPNPSKFNKELKLLATSIPSLKDYKIVLNLVTHIYPRHYLVKTANPLSLDPEKIVGGDREKESFNQNEMLVMKNLLLDPTMRYTDLANKTGLNIKTVKSVLKVLAKRNIIKGYKYIVDANRLDIQRNRLFLKLHNVSIERENQIMAYMLKTKEIVQSHKTVGDWDLEIDIESPSKSRVRYIIREMKEEYPDLIERFNLIEFYNYYKRSYLPMYLFS
ncbi:MAG: Lrp/AsnC family transcriptional regulator [archaeon]